MTFIYDTFSTPVGEFSVALNAEGAVVASAFGDLAALAKRFCGGEMVHDPAGLATVRRETTEYFDHKRRHFEVPLLPDGTPFQRNVWAALQLVPFGTTRSYGEIAGSLGQPGASRAVGRANGSNPICLFIPCHRVIGSDGSLTGYAFGAELKRLLLEHERAIAKLLL